MEIDDGCQARPQLTFKDEKFSFQENGATLFAACFVVLISLGVRQTFGLFFMDFNESLSISNTAFGFAIGMERLVDLILKLKTINSIDNLDLYVVHMGEDARVKAMVFFM